MDGRKIGLVVNEDPAAHWAKSPYVPEPRIVIQLRWLQTKSPLRQLLAVFEIVFGLVGFPAPIEFEAPTVRSAPESSPLGQQPTGISGKGKQCGVILGNDINVILFNVGDVN